MKDTGIERKLDMLRRVSIPSEMLKAIGKSNGDQIEIYVEGDDIEHYIVLDPHPVGASLIRNIDPLGRITIPAEIIRTYGLAAGHIIRFYADGERIIIGKPGLQSTAKGFDELKRENSVLKRENAALREYITATDPEFFTRKCRICGCTWDHACEGGCYWVEGDLCSKCYETMRRSSTA